MIIQNSKDKRWFQKAFAFKDSVLPKIILRLLVVTAFAVLVTAIDYTQFSLSLPILGSIVPNVILGLLLVFRTNTAYDRFWEGRKLWGTISGTSRSIARVIGANSNLTKETKIDLTNNIYNFAKLSKDKFLSELDMGQLTKDQKIMASPNLYELQLLQNKLHTLSQKGQISELSTIDITNKLDKLTSAIGGCERIISTPIPLAYSIHIKQLMLLYCFTVPFQFVGQTGWWTPVLTLVICAALMGIEEIGLEIENPFGKDRNDIDITKIVAGIRTAIDESLVL
jgi:ion channel-forming bestrophin family protein